VPDCQGLVPEERLGEDLPGGGGCCGCSESAVLDGYDDDDRGLCRVDGQCVAGVPGVVLLAFVLAAACLAVDLVGEVVEHACGGPIG